MPPEETGDVCFTANAGRAQFAERAFYLGATKEELRPALAEAPAGKGKRRGGSPEVVFVFSGQGAQYAGMGQELYRTSRCFGAAR